MGKLATSIDREDMTQERIEINSAEGQLLDSVQRQIQQLQMVQKAQVEILRAVYDVGPDLQLLRMPDNTYVFMPSLPAENNDSAE